MVFLIIAGLLIVGFFGWLAYDNPSEPASVDGVVAVNDYTQAEPAPEALFEGLGMRWDFSGA